METEAENKKANANQITLARKLIAVSKTEALIVNQFDIISERTPEEKRKEVRRVMVDLHTNLAKAWAKLYTKDELLAFIELYEKTPSLATKAHVATHKLDSLTQDAYNYIESQL